MNVITSFDPMTIFAAGIGAALVVLLVLEFYNNRRVNKLTYPVYEYALKRAEDEANKIVAAARAEARQLIDAAQAESLKLANAHKTEDDAAEKSYQDALHSLLTRLESQFKDRSKTAEEEGKRLSDEFSLQLKQQGEQSRKRLAETFDTLEKENAARIDERVAAAFAAAKTEAESYERARKEVVDRYIFDLVGETMKIVLKKELPRDVHAELVQAALEDAKANHVF